ncbi:MAG TPA: transposase, partial [Candidatus Paceibacterota bacterium]
VDGLSNPSYFQLSVGNVNDSTVTVDVLSHVDISKSNVLGDKAYWINEILDFIQRQDGEYTILPKSNTVNPWRCDWLFTKNAILLNVPFKNLNGSEV